MFCVCKENCKEMQTNIICKTFQFILNSFHNFMLGVGPMTVAMLLQNTVENAKKGLGQ